MIFQKVPNYTDFQSVNTLHNLVWKFLRGSRPKCLFLTLFFGKAFILAHRQLLSVNCVREVYYDVQCAHISSVCVCHSICSSYWFSGFQLSSNKDANHKAPGANIRQLSEVSGRRQKWLFIRLFVIAASFVIIAFLNIMMFLK